jgi:ATP-dependent Clp protease ATP-binding subunit ClpA
LKKPATISGTLGDNRKVDFSRSMIFMTSNLGSVEIGAPVRPALGFNAYDAGIKSRVLLTTAVSTPNANKSSSVL